MDQQTNQLKNQKNKRRNESIKEPLNESRMNKSDLLQSDPFEEFQMKPLTQGLGFHNRKNLDFEVANQVKNEVPKRTSAVSEDQELQDLMSALDRVSNKLAVTLTDADKTETPSKTKLNDLGLDIVQPLPKKAQSHVEVQLPVREPLPSFIEDIETPVIHPSTPQVSRKKPSIENVGVRRGAADNPTIKLKPAVFSLSSAILDTLVVLALSLMFLITLLLVTGTKLAMVFKGLQTDIMTQASLLLLYVSVLQLYVIVSRSFFGRTLGEWTFEFQMGDDQQIQTSTYPILVLWRSLITLATGIVTLPLLSLLFGKDLASYLTGLQFYKKSE